MNLERWKPLQDDHVPPDCMDWRHVQMVHAVLVNEWPQSVVEIGCARGFSASAIFEAVEKSGAIKWVDLVDPAATALLTNAVLSVHPDHAFAKFTIHPYKGEDYTKSPECWIIDGDHWIGALMDYRNARDRDARIIIIHDSRSHETIGGHGGSRYIAEYLRKEATHYFEDAFNRPNEWTHRGLTIGFMYQPKLETLKALHALV